MPKILLKVGAPSRQELDQFIEAIELEAMFHDAFVEIQKEETIDEIGNRGYRS